MPSWEALQSLAQSRYKQDVPGALKRAMENFSAGSSQGNTDIGGLTKALMSGTQTEWHQIDAFNSITLRLASAPAP